MMLDHSSVRLRVTGNLVPNVNWVGDWKDCFASTNFDVHSFDVRSWIQLKMMSTKDRASLSLISSHGLMSYAIFFCFPFNIFCYHYWWKPLKSLFNKKKKCKKKRDYFSACIHRYVARSWRYTLNLKCLAIQPKRLWARENMQSAVHSI